MLRIIGATDKGMVREVNEDRFAGEVFSPTLAYGVVCDGMGGENAGAVASALACEEIRRMMESSCREGMTPQSVYNLLEMAVTTANAVVYERARQDPDNMEGMGTTACLAIVSQGTAYLVNVGDSRGYLVRGGTLTQLTQDHTVTQMLLDRGELAPEEARDHQGRSYLTRAVGIGRGVEPFFAQTPLEPGDVLLLCSDGLYNMVPPAQLAELVGRAVERDQGGGLTQAANQNGGLDNSTAVLLACWR